MHPGLPNYFFTHPFPFQDPSRLSLAPASPRLAALHACHVSGWRCPPWQSQGDTPASLGRGCCCCCLRSYHHHHHRRRHCCCCSLTSVMYWAMTLGCCPESLCPMHWCSVCTVHCLLSALLHMSLHSFHLLFCLHTSFEFQPSCLYPVPGTTPWGPVSSGACQAAWTMSGKLSNQEWILTILVSGDWMRPVSCNYCHNTQPSGVVPQVI